MPSVVCAKCNTSYHRPSKPVEVKDDYINCPNCGPAGNLYHPIEKAHRPPKKSEIRKMSAVEMLKLAMGD